MARKCWQFLRKSQSKIWASSVRMYSERTGIKRRITNDRNTAILFVQTPDPLTAEVLAHRFHTTIMRTVHNLQFACHGVPILDVQFQSRR